MNGQSWSRVFTVLVSPGQTFRAIVERPTWVPPLLFLILAGIAFSLVAMPKLDYAEAIRTAIEGRGVAMDESAIESQIAVMERFGWVFGLLGVLLFQPVGILLIALLFWGAFKILGSEMGFRTGLAVTLHSMVPLAVATLVSLPVLLGRDSLTAEELEQGVLLSNLGFLASDDTPAWAAAALRCIDFFSLWIFALYALGYRAATRLSAGTVTATVVAFWIVWCGGKIAWAAVSSAFS